MRIDVKLKQRRNRFRRRIDLALTGFLHKIGILDMLQNLERLDLLIAHYVSGSLPEPAHVLVGSHLEMQASAGKLAGLMEGFAGDILHMIPPVALSAREHRLAEIFASAAPAEPPARIFENRDFPRRCVPMRARTFPISGGKRNSRDCATTSSKGRRMSRRAFYGYGREGRCPSTAIWGLK
ncbi:hypothetical protein LZK73_09995 [Neorhizobium galegae]|nr:hypothetical protein LZK73_09995 [Neorhizobium galegae]